LNCLYRLSLFAIVINCLPGRDADAQVELNRFFPPVVGADAETVIQAEGKFPSWPVQVACDREDVKVEATEESGKLRVVTTPDTTPGPAWVRIHDSGSASKLVPLLVQRGKVVAEVEPNNRVAEATATELPAVLVGRLEKSGDVDIYRVPARAGQTLVVSATAHHVLRSPMDAVLQLLDEHGGVLSQSDDVRGLDPQIVYEVPRDTDLLVRVFAFPETPNSTIGFAGSKEFVYALSATADAFFDHGLPLVGSVADPGEKLPVGWNLPPKVLLSRRGPTAISPTVVFASDAMGWQWRPPLASSGPSLFDSADGDDVQVAQALPLVYSGHIDRQGEVDRVRFRAVKGVKYRASVHSREFGFSLDSVLRLTDVGTSAELASNDDRSRNQFDATLEFTAKGEGEVELQISDLLDGFGPRHAYSVVVEQVSPAVELSLAADRFAVKASGSVEIPVTISRRDGFDKKLSIAAVGLPESVQAEAVISDSKGDSAKSVKLKLTADATANYQGPIRVIAHTIDDQGNIGDESFVAVHQLRPADARPSIWLTVAK
jgi:hypothetical protein